MILGKFQPPHAGHQYLVNFARHFVQRLTVLVCSIRREPIPGELRFSWMCELFPDVRVLHVSDELPQEPREHPQFWEIWRAKIQHLVGEPIDYVFASEPYGQRLAAELQATFIPVDIGRELTPVSGTDIRQRPWAHWQFLPECVRPYFMKRVCLFGPESTGKSTLARDLAARFDTAYVSEYARGWLDPRQGVCAREDIPIIARGQLAAEEALARRANRLLVCDTDLLTTMIWSEELFGDCPAWIRAEAERRQYDLYLLMDIDVPWVDDHQRYLSHRRQAFFDHCRQSLEVRHRPYVIIRGNWQERFAQACRAVQQLLQQEPTR